MNCRMGKGFTLMEMLVVAIILSIVVALGLPQYGRIRERALGKEAIANLKLIAAAEKIYRMEEGSYYPSSGDVTNITTINNDLKLSLSESNWDYSISFTVAGYNASAARQGSGGSLDCIYNLLYTDTEGEPDPNGSCP